MATIKVHTMTIGGGFGKTYDVEADDMWEAADIAEPLAEADGYTVLDATDRLGEHGDVEVTLIIED